MKLAGNPAPSFTPWAYSTKKIRIGIQVCSSAWQQATGGEAYLPKQLSEVVAICERIARDIRHQYTIGYVPSNPARDGAYRAIRVVARGKGHDRLSVRTRTGYIAGGEPRLDERGAK